MGEVHARIDTKGTYNSFTFFAKKILNIILIFYFIKGGTNFSSGVGVGFRQQKFTKLGQYWISIQ